MAGQTVLSVAVIPALDEIGTISEVVTAAAAIVDRVIVVDDGSRDGTGQVAEAAGAIVITHSRNLGVGAAISSGLARALELGADVVVQLDGDGQHDASYAPLLIEKVRRGDADLVIGTRFELGFEIGFVRRIVLRLFALPVSRRIGTPITDPTSGFRGFSANAAKTLAPVFPVKYLSDTVELLYLAHEHGLRIQTVPVRMRERTSGQPSVNLIQGIGYVIRLMSIIVRHSIGGARRR